MAAWPARLLKRHRIARVNGRLPRARVGDLILWVSSSPGHWTLLGLLSFSSRAVTVDVLDRRLVARCGLVAREDEVCSDLVAIVGVRRTWAVDYWRSMWHL